MDMCRQTWEDIKMKSGCFWGIHWGTENWKLLIFFLSIHSLIFRYVQVLLWLKKKKLNKREWDLQKVPLLPGFSWALLSTCTWGSYLKRGRASQQKPTEQFLDTTGSGIVGVTTGLSKKKLANTGHQIFRRILPKQRGKISSRLKGVLVLCIV